MQSTSRIFAGVSGSPGSMHALRHAAGLACQHAALLIPPLTWVPPEEAGHGLRGWAFRHSQVERNSP
jgi:hypothetical protein